MRERVKSFKRAWEAALLRAHGHKPQYVIRTKTSQDGKLRKMRTGVLTPESRTPFQAIDLHFHDLRREAGSRWLDSGVPLHGIQKWLGHANISQTSTYVMADSADDDEAMGRFEARQSAEQFGGMPGESAHQLASATRTQIHGASDQAH